LAGKGGVDSKLQLLARLGFLSRGVVYVVIGAVAARVALLNRGRTTGPGGALRRIFELGHGQAALIAVGAGLLSFALFRLVQAKRVKGTAKIGYIVGALGALFLTVSAAGLLLGLRRQGASPIHEGGAWLLSHPWGRALLGLGGAIACVAGLVEIVRGVIGRLPRDFEAAVMEKGRRRWARRLARLGVFAHGVVVGMVGASIVQAAFDIDEREIMGTGGALRRLKLATSPVVFAVVAVGLIAYGLSLLVLAAHRRSRLR
jgi:hypothetical protein